MSILNEQMFLDEVLACSVFEEEQINQGTHHKLDEELSNNLEREQSTTNTIAEDMLPSNSGSLFDSDFQYALQVSTELNTNGGSYSADLALAKQLDQECFISADILKDEIPNIYELFLLFNKLYFDNKLPWVEVEWSTDKILERW